MTIEHHVTSIDLSRKLRDLGVPQTALFKWCHEARKRDGEDDVHVEVAFWPGTLFRHKDGRSWDDIDQCSAFLASELGSLLPNEVDGFSWRTLKTPRKGAWEIKYRKREAGRFHPVILHQLSDPREPDARARMLIWLIEARLVDPKKLAA